jgi:hypothetical protein
LHTTPEGRLDTQTAKRVHVGVHNVELPFAKNVY